MSYYILKEALSPKKIGKHYPQSNKMSSGYPYNAPNSVWQIRNERLSFIPNLDAFVLNGQSKLTDIISIMSPDNKHNILIKTDLVKIWKNLNICDYQVFPATVIYKRKKIDYSLLHFYNYQDQLIDFSKTNFIHRGFGRKKIKDLSIHSHEDFIKHTVNPQNEVNPDYAITATEICPTNLVLSEDKIDLDFFLILKDQYDIGYVISEQFKDRLLQENATGFDLLNVNEYESEVVI